MDRDEIERILREAAGDPSTGAVRDVLPELADAVAQALQNTSPALSEKQKRIVKADEMR